VVVSFWAQPFLIDHVGHDQYLFSTLHADDRAGFASYIDTQGFITVVVGSDSGRQTARFDVKFARHIWYFVTVTVNVTSRNIAVSAESKGSHVTASQTEQQSITLGTAFDLVSSRTLTIASHSSEDRVSSVILPSTTFNGKLDTFKIEFVNDGSVFTVLHLDFSKDIPTEHIVDVSDGALRGRLLNCPARAVTGHDWDASQTAWAHATYGYGAIHFHDDDVDDAAWLTDFEIALPKDLASGCYGVVINDDVSEDVVPVFVRPDLDQEPKNKVVFIFPTFTYAAYANDRMYDTSRDVHIDIPGSDSVIRSRHTEILEARPDLGISLYDSHNDGSGTTHSSLKRVVLNMRSE
jgi:hypothetical protein